MVLDADYPAFIVKMFVLKLHWPPCIHPHPLAPSPSLWRRGIATPLSILKGEGFGVRVTNPVFISLTPPLGKTAARRGPWPCSGFASIPDAGSEPHAVPDAA